MTPTRASARANAASKSSIACTIDASEKISASPGVDARLSIRRMILLYIEENGLAIAAEVNFEVPGFRCTGLREQRLPAFRGNHREDRVVRVCRIAREIHTRVQMFEEPTREDDQVDVRRLERTTRSHNASRMRGLKRADAVFVRSQSSESAK